MILPVLPVFPFPTVSLPLESVKITFAVTTTTDPTSYTSLVMISVELYSGRNGLTASSISSQLR